MKKTLLGHLYTRIKGSQEDVATMSLQYLLAYYDHLRESFNDLISQKLKSPVDKGTSYECQSIGVDLERPDMSGTDTEGKEIILCEAKFYAGLTDNQPLTYLKRLKREKGIGLVFICPQDRVISLWDTLLYRCKRESIKDIEEHCVSVNGINMTVVSWEEIILTLTQTANALEKDSLADIEQLKGYCDQMVSDAFIPFKEEDLGAWEAKKYERLMYIVDRVVDALLADKSISADIKGLKTTPYTQGYKRFIRINGFSIDFRLDLEAWSDDKFIDTPYWVNFRDSDWKTPKEFIGRVSMIPSTKKRVWHKEHVYLAIDVPCGVVEDEVVDAIKKQIIDYMHLFE